MRITVCAVGRLKKGPWRALVDEYIKRLNWSVTVVEVEAKAGLSGTALKDEEGQLLLKNIPEDSYSITLDEKGRESTSRELSQKIEHIQHHGGGKICFVIGGADGLSDAVKSRANQSISFGRTTWPHMMVRVMLLEQVYRAQQILNGHPYHRE